MQTLLRFSKAVVLLIFFLGIAGCVWAFLHTHHITYASTLACCLLNVLVGTFFFYDAYRTQMIQPLRTLLGFAFVFGSVFIVLAFWPTVQILGDEAFGFLWERMLLLWLMTSLLTAFFAASWGVLAEKKASFFQFKTYFLEFMLARRFLNPKSTRMRSVTAWVSIIGIVLGVAALTCVTAVMSGYQQEIEQRILSTNAHFMIQKYSSPFTEYNTIERIGLSLEHVIAASPFVYSEALLSAENGGVGVLLKGVDVAKANRVTDIEKNLCVYNVQKQVCAFTPQQKFQQYMVSDDKGTPAVVVGFELAKRLGIKPNDFITLTTPLTIAQSHGTSLKRITFQVRGFFQSGMYEFDNRLVYVDLNSAQELLGLKDAVSGVEFRLKNPEDVATVSKEFLNALDQYPYASVDWRELNSGIFTALQLQKIVMFLVLVFIIVVAAFNLASTLFMVVVEKTKHLAILSTLGASMASRMRIFILQGWFIALMGIVLGMTLGISAALLMESIHIHIAADVYMVNRLHVRIQPLELAAVFIATLMIAHLSAFYPAMKAAQLLPVDGLKD